jgi:WD40 repeat protein
MLAQGLAVLPDNRYAVTGGMDGSIRVWKLPDLPPAGRK